MVNAGSRAHPTYLPPEVCEVLRGQSANRIRLDGAQTTRMIGVAVRKPAETAQTIVETGLRAVGLGAENTLQVRRRRSL